MLVLVAVLQLPLLVTATRAALIDQQPLPVQQFKERAFWHVREVMLVELADRKPRRAFDHVQLRFGLAGPGPEFLNGAVRFLQRGSHERRTSKLRDTIATRLTNVGDHLVGDPALERLCLRLSLTQDEGV